jgi:hypothetical protein
MTRTLVRLLSIHAIALFTAGLASAQALQPGEVLVGAAKVSIEPRPNPALGQRWERNEAACELGLGLAAFATDTRTSWPENPNCIYAGGFGIGPQNSLVQWDQEFGLWARSVVISDGVDTVVLTILDASYYLGRYRNLCARCGWFSIAEDLGAELRIPRSGFLLASTHAHSAPDFIGGWGAVPQWYMDQVTEAIKTSIRQAYASRQPARLEVGDKLLRRFNTERRDIYWSPEEDSLSWFRAVDRAGNGIATVISYARHPTSRGSGTPMAHADWHGPFSKRAEERFGGVALAFPSGLGNMSGRGGWEAGDDIADEIPGPGQGIPVPNPDVRSRQVFWKQPVTNSALLALGVNGLFDRPMLAEPSTVTTGKAAANGNACVSTSTISVETAVTAIRVGNLTLTGGPGELFANITNTIREEEHERGQTAIPISIANDGLGYIMQDFEYNAIAGQVVGFVAADNFGYEDAYAIDGCFGTKVLQTTLEALNGL